MGVPESLVGRAEWLLGGVHRRAREHAWSAAQWSKKRQRLVWASVLATAASVTAVAEAFAQTPPLAIVAAVLAAFAAGTAEYERRTDPSKQVQDHTTAQVKFELLVSDFRHFVQHQATHLPADEAERIYDQIEARRKEAVASSVPVEPDAHRALGPDPRASRAEPA